MDNNANSLDGIREKTYFGNFENGQRQCAAKSKRSGNQCRGVAMRGKKVCYIHGGRSRGPNDPLKYNERSERGRRNIATKKARVGAQDYSINNEPHPELLTVYRRFAPSLQKGREDEFLRLLDTHLKHGLGTERWKKTLEDFCSGYLGSGTSNPMSV